MIPFIDLKPYVELVRGYPDDTVADLFNTLEFIGGGPTTQRLEGALAAKLAVPHVVTCANGTDALMLALRAAGIERGTRVAMPNLTFWATYEAVVNVGATPVLLDIDPDDLQLSFEEFVRAHNKRQFDAAILVHLYGWCSKRLVEFRSLCRNRNITLVEDGAQAFGVNVNGESIFTGADIATLSFHPAKVLGAIGDGGAVLCKSARTAARVRMFANHGRIDHYQHVAVGWNSRMDAIQAVWLLRALEVSDKVLKERLSAALCYGNWSPPGVVSNGYLDVMLVNDRDVWRKRMRDRGIETGCVYPSTIVDQDGAHGAVAFGSLAVSREIAHKVVNRPLFYGITSLQLAQVLEVTG